MYVYIYIIKPSLMLPIWMGAGNGRTLGRGSHLRRQFFFARFHRLKTLQELADGG